MKKIFLFVILGLVVVIFCGISVFLGRSLDCQSGREYGTSIEEESREELYQIAQSRVCLKFPRRTKEHMVIDYVCPEDKVALKDLMQVVFLRMGADTEHMEGTGSFLRPDERAVAIRTLRTLPDPITTPYVLVVPLDIASELDERTSLHRLVEVAEVTKADFVGGSLVVGHGNLRDGHWRTETGTCMASAQLKHWQLKFTPGYRHSSLLDCQKCAVVVGPVLVRSEVLVHTHLRALKGRGGLLEDLQLRHTLTHAHSTAVACPDVMFRVASDAMYPDPHIRPWWPFFKEWAIERFITGQGQSLGLGAGAGVVIDADCQNADLRLPFRNWQTGLSSTPCELLDYCYTSTCFMLGAQHHNLTLYHSDGNGLGALKFNGMPLVWEGDFDVSVRWDQIDQFHTALPQILAHCGSRASKNTTGHVVVRGPMNSKLDIYRESYKIFQYHAHWQANHTLITQIPFCGYWTNGPFNTGAQHRSRFGPAIFRHATSWHVTGARDGTRAQYSRSLIMGEGMAQCKAGYESHHACLGGLVDGDLHGVYPFEFVRERMLKMRLDEQWDNVD